MERDPAAIWSEPRVVNRRFERRVSAPGGWARGEVELTSFANLCWETTLALKGVSPRQNSHRVPVQSQVQLRPQLELAAATSPLDSP